jgi:hypothetical protein
MPKPAPFSQTQLPIENAKPASEAVIFAAFLAMFRKRAFPKTLHSKANSAQQAPHAPKPAPRLQKSSHRNSLNLNH